MESLIFKCAVQMCMSFLVTCCTYPLFIQLEQLLWDLGGVGCLPQTLNTQLWDNILQDFLEGQAPGSAVPGCGRDSIF